MSNIPSSASAAADAVNPEQEHESEAPGAARNYIDAVLEQSFRHLFGPTATPEQPRKHDVVSIAKLTSMLAGYMSPDEIKEVKAAFHFSDEAHLGQYRQSGEPYITHPVAVAESCAGWKLDAQAIMAALLHDVMEDNGVTKAELAERFGAPVAELVDGVVQARQDGVSHSRRGAGREFPQDAAGDGARRARHPDQARRPAAQHAHARRGAACEAPPHRPRNARNLRAHRPPARA